MRVATIYRKQTVGVIGLIAVAGAIIWWQTRDSAPGGAMDPAIATGENRRSSRTKSGRSMEDTGTTISARVPKLSENNQVRALSKKLAEEFSRDSSILATRLADEDNRHLAYDIGRDLIAMFPEKADELMAGFKATQPPELSSYLCGSLVESVAARGKSDQALALAGGLEPGRNRKVAFTHLAASLNPRDYGQILEKIRNEGLSDDVRRLDSGLSFRVAEENFPVEELESLMALDLSADASTAVSSAYGRKLIEENGRATALEKARSLPVNRQAPALYGVLLRGASQDDGSSWLLGALGSIDPAIDIDRASLTTGVAEMMRQEKSGESAMEWALSISDTGLREATVSGAMRSLLQENQAEASAWLGKQPPGSAKDAGITDMAKFLSSHGDIESARAWLGEMQDARKKQVLEEVIEVLSRGAAE